MHLTAKLNWYDHIECIRNKARKSLNFLKVISTQSWGKDPSTLIHLATSLIRSKLAYAQEVVLSAPKHLLKKLQGIDSKAYKLALGLPVYSSSMKTYEKLQFYH